MKYIGSKAKIANEIVPILQNYISAYNIKQYVEPFAGGFNVIDKIQCEYRLGNDIDPLVCELVEACRENPALLDELETPTRAEYYDVRDNHDKYARWYRAAVLFIRLLQRPRVRRLLWCDSSHKRRQNAKLLYRSTREFSPSITRLAQYPCRQR